MAEAVAAAHDLTPIQAKVMLSLGQPEPMRCLADELGCDPSNVTSLVDKLEERGLLTRAGAKEDRRVKVLAATAAGTKLREALSSALFGSVPGLDALTTSQVADLRHLLGKMCAANEAAEAIDGVRVGTAKSDPEIQKKLTASNANAPFNLKGIKRLQSQPPNEDELTTALAAKLKLPIRSRTPIGEKAEMPALFTTPSMRPHVSMPAWMIFCSRSLVSTRLGAPSAQVLMVLARPASALP